MVTVVDAQGLPWEPGPHEGVQVRVLYHCPQTEVMSPFSGRPTVSDVAD